MQMENKLKSNNMEKGEVSEPKNKAEMKEINGYLLVKCPEDYWCFHFNEDGDIEAYPKDGGGGVKPIGWYLHKIDLPKGNYSIIGLAKDLTEEQWKGIVDCHVFVGYSAELDGGYAEEWFKDYTDVQQIVGSDYNLDSAEASGHSLLKANNLNPNNCLILKKIL